MPPSPLSGWAHELTAFNPFSFGPASCVGKNLALVELRVVACAVLQKFEFEFANAGMEGFDATEWEEGIRDTFVVTRPPLMVRVKTKES